MLPVISRIDKRGGGELDVIFEDLSTTFVDPLVDYILKEDSEASASYVVEHHLKGPLRLTVRSTKVDPEELIARAIDRLVGDIDKVKLDLEKGI
jgi:DNA-directed RNA polymerase subunit L